MDEMDFHVWFKEYHKSYDLRCGMTELHMKAAFEAGRKELEEQLKCSSESTNTIGENF